MSARTAPQSAEQAAFRLYHLATQLAGQAAELKEAASQLLLRSAEDQATTRATWSAAIADPPRAAAAVPPPIAGTAIAAREAGVAVATTAGFDRPAKRDARAAARLQPAKQHAPANRQLDLEPANAELRAARRP